MKKKMLSFTMMKRFRLIFFSSLLITTALLSCSKGGVVDPGGNGGGGGPHIIDLNDTIPPALDIYTPTANQVFTNGNTIGITGKVTDNGGLYRGTIKITNDATGAVVKEQLYEIHGFQSYNFNISHTTSVTTASDYTVTVSFEDHGYNTTTKSVKVKINP
jgi:hypothetical protein